MKMLFSVAVVLAITAIPATAVSAAETARRDFGRMPDGRAVEAITLRNRQGVSATIITYGAALQSLVTPDAHGVKADIALGHATLDEYLAKRQFMGATIGRVANRIAGARFVLDGKAYQIPANDGVNALHGGVSGFDRAVWTLQTVKADADAAEVVLHHLSPDGDQGFPGNLDVTVTYRLDERNQLTIDLRATTDRTTVVSLANHAYWNLAGEGAARGAMEQVLEIPADDYSPVDSVLIPTGEFRTVNGTPFDFRKPRAIGTRVRTADDDQIRIGRGYDHNWVVTRKPTRDIHLMARVTDPRSGRTMTLSSDQPGLQFYSGNFLDGTTRGKSGQLYRQGDAIVLEAQAFPDTVDRPAFGSVRLDPSETYRSVSVYKFEIVSRSR